MHTVEKIWDRLTILEFNDWLTDKAEAHDRMKLSSGEPKAEHSNPSTNATNTKTGTKTFALTCSIQTASMGVKAENSPSSCIACK